MTKSKIPPFDKLRVVSDLSRAKSKEVEPLKAGKLLILVILLLVSMPIIVSSPNYAFAQVDTAWVRRYNGPGDSTDASWVIAVDGSGNVYVTGYSWGSGTGPDYATIKYYPSGDTAWVRRYNRPGNSNDEASAIAVDGSGNVYVTGGSYDLVTDYDYATIKYYPSGDTAWVRRYNGPGNEYDRAEAIAVDGSGNVYVTGGSYDPVTDYDYATIKYYPNGDTAWVRRYNGQVNDNDLAIAIAVDGSGNVYVTGDVCNRSWYGYDIATIKYYPNGDTAWLRIYNAGLQDHASAMAVDGSGNVYVAGRSMSYDVNTHYDYVTIKYYPDGSTAWVGGYGVDYCPWHPWNSSAVAIVTDGSGNVYVTGSAPGACVSDTDFDYATIKYYPNGDRAWVRIYNGPGNGDDYASAIAIDGSGNVYVTGHSVGSGTGDDYATIKYYPDGDTAWVRRYNGPGNEYDGAEAIAVDGSGNVYVTGGSYDLVTDLDYATIKYVETSLLGNIAGIVKDASTQQNLQDVLVEALQGGVLKGSDNTNSSGEYSIPNLIPGTYDVRASRWGYETQTQNGIPVFAGQTTTVDFQLMPLAFADVSGIVRNIETEAPIAGALVELRQGGQTIYSTYTQDLDGNFSFDHFYSGTYEIRVTKEGYDTYVEDVTIEPGYNIISIRLYPLDNVITLLDANNNTIEGAFVERYHNGMKDQAVLVSDQNGKVRFAELYDGDEIYAYKILGIGRTDKGGSHPKVPDEWCPETPPPGCDPCNEAQPWYYFYKYVLDNQSVDGSNTLRKYYYQDGVQSVYLTHKITRLHLVLSHDYDINVNDKASYLQALNGHFEKLNPFLFDATNGQVLIDQVDVYAGKNNDALGFTDVIVHPDKQALPSYVWPSFDLKFPPYIASGLLHVDYRYKNWADFYRGITHELGHYFLNLGDEYTTKSRPECWFFDDFCTGDHTYQDYHASIMVFMAKSYQEITEFCWEGHNANPCLTQNNYHNGMSCWGYIFSDWNNFENNIPLDQCKEYLLGDPIEWKVPQNSPGLNYQEGPYLESPISTSQKPVINDFIIENPGARELVLSIHDSQFGTNVKGVSIGVQSGNGGPIKTTKSHVQGGSFRMRGFWELGSAVDTIRLVGILPNDEILIFAEGYEPLQLLSDTIPDIGEVHVTRTTPESTFFDYVFGKISSDGQTVDIYLLTTDTTTLSPSISVWQGASVTPIQGSMMKQNDTTYSFSFATDSNFASDGVILIQDAITGQMILSSWNYEKIISSDYNAIHLCNQATIYVDSGSISSSGYVLGLTSKVPKGSVSEDIFGCVPQYISFSDNISFISPAVLGLYYGSTTIDSTAVALKWYSVANSWLVLDSVYSVAEKEVYCDINGDGLFVSRVEPIHWVNYGDANGDGVINVTDVVYLINYLFISGPAPDPIQAGDANCDGTISASDVVYLINYLFIGGPPPCR